jgi:hypothetical protein
MKNNYTFKIDDDVLARLRAVEERDGVTVSEQIRRAIAAYLAQGGASRAVTNIVHGKPGPREFKKAVGR